MRGLKLLLVVLAGIVFQLGIAGLVLSVIFLQILATPEPLKTSLQSAGVYETVLDDVYAQFDEQTDDLDAEGEVMQQAARDAFSEDVLRTEVEQAIDATYDWLRGDTDALAFTIDFSDVQTAFVETLRNNLKAQLADTPTCTSPAQFQPNTEVWELNCVPPGVDRDRLVDAYMDESLTHDDFLGDMTFSSEDMLADADFDTQKIPTNFQRLENSLLLAIVITIASALTIIGLSASKKKGIRRAGNQLTFAGGGFVLSAVLLWLFVRPELLMGGSFENATQEAVLSALTLLIHDALIIAMVAGGAFLLAGIILRLIFRKPKKK